MADRPADNEALKQRATSRRGELQPIGATLLGLVALTFSDLTSTFANDSPRPLIAIVVTTALLAALGLSYAWAWFGTVERRAPLAGDTLDGELYGRYQRARIAGLLTIGLIAVAAICYLSTAWFWAA